MRNLLTLAALSTVVSQSLDSEGVSSGSATSDGSPSADRSHVLQASGVKLGDDSNEDEEDDSDSDTSTTTKAKRTKKSPRDNAFEEVVSFLDAKKGYMAKKYGVSEDAFEFLRSNIVSMIGSKRSVENVYEGTHYIGVSKAGERHHFKSNARVSKTSGGTENFMQVYGPWKKTGEVLALFNKPIDQSKLVFQR